MADPTRITISQLKPQAHVLPLYGHAMRARAAGARVVAALACGHVVVFGGPVYEALREQPFLAGRLLRAFANQIVHNGDQGVHALIRVLL